MYKLNIDEANDQLDSKINTMLTEIKEADKKIESKIWWYYCIAREAILKRLVICNREEVKDLQYKTRV